MEELTIDDLSFENAAGDTEVFDAFAVPNTEAKEGNETPAVPATPAAPNVQTNTPPASEGITSPESVATGDTNQGQADKANTTEGAASSSSPKLNDSESLFSNLASHFVDKGVLSDLDPKEIKSIEDIQVALQKQVEKGLTETQAAINEAIKVGAPADVVAQQVDTIGKLKGISDEMITNEGNAELRLNLIAQDFQNRGYDADRAKTMAQRSIDAGVGVEDAKLALQGILKTEQDRYSGIIQAAKDKENQSLTDIKKFMADTKEIVPGIPLTSVQNEEIFTQMTANVGNDQSAFIKYQSANPVSSRIKLETVFYLTKGLTDFSVFGQNASTSTARTLEDQLRGMSFTEDGRVQTVVADDNSNFSLQDFGQLQVSE